MDNEVALPNNNADPPLQFLIVNLFNRLSKEHVDRWRKGKGISEYKGEVIRQFVEGWRKAADGKNLYPVLRLVMPTSDRDRSPYYIKEATLGDLVMEIFGIDKSSADGKKIKDYGSSANNKNAGYFANVAAAAIHNRLTSHKFSNITINELNQKLDELAEAGRTQEDEKPNSSSRRRRFVNVLNELKAFHLNSQEWEVVLNVILKHVRMGIQEQTFLRALNPDLQTAMDTQTDLKKLCTKLTETDGKGHVLIQEQDKPKLVPGQPFRPQLANASFREKNDLFLHICNELGDDKGCYLEEKIDGERLLMHMTSETNVEWVNKSALERGASDLHWFDTVRSLPVKRFKDENGGFIENKTQAKVKIYHRKFKYFTRRIMDYTHFYGEDPSEGKISPWMQAMLPTTVYEIILDGEVAAWDKEKQKYLEFGTLKTVLTEEENDRVVPRYMVFDILYMNGQDLRGQSLASRKMALLNLFWAGRTVAEFVDHVDVLPFAGPLNRDNGEPVITDQNAEAIRTQVENYCQPIVITPEELRNKMMAVVEESTEGLVIKRPSSLYMVNSRGPAWMKLKPEFFGGMSEEFDVLVLGGTYGHGKRGGGLAAYLCGVRKDDNTFLTFCRVGGGFKVDDYKAIERKTEGKWRKFDKSNRLEWPPHIVFPKGMRRVDMPDEWIRPQDSVVLEVRATEFSKTDVFATDMTLRFPRFTKLRDDKSYMDCMTVKDLDTVEREVSRHLTDLNKQAAIAKQRKRHKKVPRIQGSVDFSNQEVASDILSPYTFHVPANEPKSEKLKKRIVKYGGKITASKEKAQLVITSRKARAEYSGDVVKPHYIDDCVRAGWMVAIEPAHLTNPTRDRKNEAAKNVDKFGYPLKRTLREEELKQLLVNMDVSGYEDYEVVHPEVYQLLEEHVFNTKWFMMRNMKVYVHERGVRDYVHIASLARLMGATVTESVEEPDIAVFVALDEDAVDMLKAKSARQPDKHGTVVGKSYVLDCWQEETLLVESRYALN